MSPFIYYVHVLQEGQEAGAKKQGIENFKQLTRPLNVF